MDQNFITVNEVGPRDGLQNISKIVDPEGRIELINSYKKCGITSVEIGSFVSPKVVPAMSGTELVINGLNIKSLQKCELKNIKVVRKSLVAKNDIKKGQRFDLKNLTSKRPANGISPMFIKKIIGKKATKNFKKDQLIKI